jgi:hypothetical protein
MINEKPVMAVAAAGLTPIFPVIEVTPMVEIPVFDKTEKSPAVLRSTIPGPCATEGVKRAMIFLVEFMFTVNGLAVPVASPFHEEKSNPEFGVGVRITFVPFGYVNWSGFLETDPFNAVIFRVKLVAFDVKFAVIFLFPSTTTVNGFFDPVASPLHDENV